MRKFLPRGDFAEDKPGGGITSLKQSFVWILSTLSIWKSQQFRRVDGRLLSAECYDKIQHNLPTTIQRKQQQVRTAKSSNSSTYAPPSNRPLTAGHDHLRVANNRKASLTPWKFPPWRPNLPLLLTQDQERRTYQQSPSSRSNGKPSMATSPYCHHKTRLLPSPDPRNESYFQSRNLTEKRTMITIHHRQPQRSARSQPRTRAAKARKRDYVYSGNKHLNHI